MRRVTLLLALLAAGTPATDASQERPNLLVIVTDDQRGDTLGCAGHPFLQTPSIDGLAADGVRFENAFVTTPICAASRASLLTGTWERRHGYTFGTPPLADEEIAASYPVLLRESGYRTGFIGKFGVRTNADATDGMFDFHRSYGQPFVKTMPDGTARHLTDITGDDALDFLDGCEAGKPFCLTLSFNAPHAEDATRSNPYPHSPPEAELYVDDVLPPPLVESDFWEGLPSFFADSLHRVRWFWRWDTPEKYDRFLRDYYRMVTGIDRVIGDVLAELRRRELADNTVVLFIADNGYYLGSRGFAGKWSHYRESLWVPFVVHDPRAPSEARGRVVEELALNVDLAPTILELAGLTPPPSVQGASLAGTVQGEPAPDRTDFLFEHLFDHAQIPRMEGVRGERYVYARYIDHLPEGEFLHDLVTDPLERENLARDPAHAERLEALRRRCDALIALRGAPEGSRSASDPTPSKNEGAER